MNPNRCHACSGHGQILVETHGIFTNETEHLVRADKGTCTRCDGTGVEPLNEGKEFLEARVVTFDNREHARLHSIYHRKLEQPENDDEL